MFLKRSVHFMGDSFDTAKIGAEERLTLHTRSLAFMRATNDCTFTVPADRRQSPQLPEFRETLS